MTVLGRVWIDNEAGKFVRLSPTRGAWVDVLPFRPVAQALELGTLCFLLQDEDDGSRCALSAYTYDGVCLWTRTAEELPMTERSGRFMVSQMQTGRKRELRLNKGDAWCLIEGPRAPRFGSVQLR